MSRMSAAAFAILMDEWPEEMRRKNLEDPYKNQPKRSQKETITFSIGNGKKVKMPAYYVTSSANPYNKEYMKMYNLEKAKFEGRRYLEEGLLDDFEFLLKTVESLGIKAQFDEYYTKLPKCISQQCSLFCNYYSPQGCEYSEDL